MNFFRWNLLKIIVIGMSFAAVSLSASAAERESYWVWSENPPADRATRYLRFRFDLNGKVRSAPVAFACDDLGKVYVNGRVIDNHRNQKAVRRNLAGELKTGRNVIAFEAYNALRPAGVILRGEVLLEDGTEIPLFSDTHFVTNQVAPAGWNRADFDDSGWKPAVRIGKADMAPFHKLTDTSFFMAEPEGKPEIPGRVLLDDFADISSWLGGPGEGARPGAAHPFEFSFGSVPDGRRDDGWAGALHFDTVAPRGLARFGKNRVFQMRLKPRALLFSADAEGNSGEVAFRFIDRFDREYVTNAVRIGGNGWRDYRLELNGGNVPGWSKIGFPVVLREVWYRNDVPATGRILLDDFFCVADVSDPARQIELNPDYAKLAYRVNEPVGMSFRVRNALDEQVAIRFTLKVYDADRNLLVARDGEKLLAPGGFGRIAFDLGRFASQGGYAVELAADNGRAKTLYRGWLGVFEPNHGRVNRVPMWFGIEDQEVNTAPYEANLHAAWMKLLGVDMMRGGFLGAKAEAVRGSSAGYEGFRRMWQAHIDAGLDICLDYAGGLPGWTRGSGKSPGGVIRPNGQDPELFREHITRVAEFIRSVPRIKWFEWLNEPNLGWRLPNETYMEALRQIYPIMKRTAPGVLVGTGGLVIAPHPAAVAGFVRQTYVDNAPSYDIAFYHAHDGLTNYRKFTGELMGMVGGKPFANTEAGFRSYHDAPELFYAQARILVQKITYSRSVGMEFYIWFMLQDYWDKYINADDSFGLVTVDNQPKPSFVAYNELIRQLADTKAAANVELDGRLESYRFTGPGGEVFVAWPKRENGTFSFCLKSDTPVRLIDLFGNVTELRPVNGIVYVNTPKLPFYLRAATGAVTPVGELLRTPGDAVRLPGESRPLEVTCRNPYRETIRYAAQSGTVKFSGEIGIGETAQFALPLTVAASSVPGIRTVPVEIELRDAAERLLYQGTVALQVFIALPVGSPGSAPWIRLDREEQLSELVFDPTTPRWAGVDDLSAQLRVGRAADRLIFEAEVRDQSHSAPFAGMMNWRNDSIQLGFANAAGEHFELTVSDGPDGKPIAWRHLAPAEAEQGPVDLPLAVTHGNGVTRYRFEIPFRMLRIAPDSGERFRMAFLVNDNDGGKRLRIMEYFGGIEGSKDSTLFGWCQLQ